MNMARAGVDTGGTFTDVVTAAGEVVKLPSDPVHPARAVAEGVRQAGGAALVAHGTTVATNALLERAGGRVALITTAGYRDTIEIARQARPSLYDQRVDRPQPLVPRMLRFEIDGRLDATGKELTPLGPAPALPSGLDAVAVCLLHADLNPQQELEIAAAMAPVPVVLSSDVSPEFREYERTVTTVVDAYLRRPCRAYLEDLAAVAPEVLVMTSAGGLIPRQEAANRPVKLLLSGPAGGVLAAAALASAGGFADGVTLDMGGTSTDVCLIRGGRPEPAAQRHVAGLPIRMPALDVHTIGAGGGSIARIDPGGALVVGPQSAGADPGPACYGRGGQQATVTDADLVAGRIPVDGFSGLGRLDLGLARRALDNAGVTAEGVIAVVDQAMAQALRAVSVQRGVDPAGLTLVAFGGAGPLHACALADDLGLRDVVVPPRAGVFSAAGILGAPRQVDLVRSWPDPGDHVAAAAALAALGREARQRLGTGAEVEMAMDCRYVGQSHELTVPAVEEFELEHRRRNGFVLDRAPVEVVALRATARLALAGGRHRPARHFPPRDGPGTGGDRRTGLHHLGGRRLAGRCRPLRIVAAGESGMTVDPAQLQILISQLTGVATEMGEVLRRSALSPNIKERADCSAAVFTAGGELLVQAEHIPVHLGSMPASVAAAIAAALPLGPGDQVVLNDPFAGGTHLNDITLVAPCFVDGRLVGWVANRAHHADVGGMAPGRFRRPPPRSSRRACASRPCSTAEVAALVAANRARPVERRGRSGRPGRRQPGRRRAAGGAGDPAADEFAEVVDYGERRMRAALAGLPDGTWEARTSSTRPAPAPSAPAGRHPAGGHHQGRRHHIRLHRHRQAATGQHQRRRGGHRQRRRLGPAGRHRSDDPRQRRRAAPCPARDPARHPGRGRAAGRGRRRQRRGEPAGRRRLPAGPGRGGAGRVGAAGQGTMNNLILGGRSGWVYYETIGGGQGGRPGRARHERRAHRHDQHHGHADRGPGAGLSRPRAALPAAGWQRRRRAVPGGDGIERVCRCWSRRRSH